MNQLLRLASQCLGQCSLRHRAGAALSQSPLTPGVQTSSNVMTFVQGRTMARTASLFFLLLATAAFGVSASVESYLEAPRVTVALEQGRAAELGIGIRASCKTPPVRVAAPQHSLSGSDFCCERSRSG